MRVRFSNFADEAIIFFDILLFDWAFIGKAIHYCILQELLRNPGAYFFNHILPSFCVHHRVGILQILEHIC